MRGSFADKSLDAILDEQIVFSQLADNENALWSLLLASGYMKAEGRTLDEDSGDWIYRLSITNLEVRYMFQKMIRRWFGGQNVPWRDFVGALIKGELEEMNLYMNQVSKETFSSFDTGTKPSDDSHPERFYHGFVLGLLAGEVKRYEIRSNRESGYGRYDVVMIPRNPSLYPVLPAVIMEFKDMDRKKEASLHDTAQEALRQIRDLEYNTEILERGIKPEHIHYYGFAFPRGEALHVAKQHDILYHSSTHILHAFFCFQLLLSFVK